jgi:hypothetical protein
MRRSCGSSTGLRADSPWIEPESKHFDPQAVIRKFQDWQYQPFVRFVVYIKQQLLEHPYYQERLAMLKVWVDSGAYRSILARREDPAADHLIEVVKIQAFELASEGQTVDPYVMVTDGNRQVLRTRYASAVRNVQWKGFKSTDPGVDQPRACSDGQPLFFEIWDSNYFGDTFLGGLVVYPEEKDARSGADGELLADYTAKIHWDWKEPQSVSRPGHARVWVRFTKRQAPVQAEVTREAG